jgi:hypothetical protein
MSRARRKVEPHVLRETFNAGDYHGMVQRGELTALRESERPADPSLGLPEGTRSEIWHYYLRDLTKVAVVHQMVLPDGSLLNGRPDPKALMVNDELWHC